MLARELLLLVLTDNVIREGLSWFRMRSVNNIK